MDILYKPAILLLGHRGMAGHMIYNYLNKKHYKVTAADELIEDKFNILKNLDKFEEKLKFVQADYIINCTGLLVKKCEESPIDAIKINSLFPHQLVKIANSIGAHVIHLSSDCYMDNNVYGRSKRAGEINYQNHLTIRTSIIGPELKRDGVGLFEWFMRQEKEINGYSDVLWDGITTLELSKFLEWYIEKEDKLFGIKNLRSPNSISKYDILNLIKKIYKKDIKINKFDNINENKTEKNDFLDYHIHEYERMIREMFEFSVVLKK
ncbi:putative dTDP-4-dehydrorhamnose reductase [groundwater metagenome]|uniref:Putative dTDP-4-dehydrorhamnose reductase n=1 Tax=groundwater metagenome TaxID=717931 RepID=A0A098EE57_9ZZZZ